MHGVHITGGGVASAKHPATQAVNTVLGNFKTSLAGTHHAFDFGKYGRHYFSQVHYLFNRRIDVRSILQRLARAAAQDAPCPLCAVRAVESSC